MEKVKRWFMWFVHPLLNERGEVGEDDLDGEKSGEKKTEILEEDPHRLVLSQEDYDPEKVIEEEKRLEEEKKKLEEEKKVSTPSEKERELETRVARLESDKSNLKKALHEERQGKKALKETEGTALTDLELTKIIQEHKDDPAVLLNAVSYKMQQLLKKGKSEAVDEVEVKQKQGQLNQMLRERYGDALDDDSSVIRTHINKAKEFLGLNDHPFGDSLGAAVAVFSALPQLLKESYEKGVKDQVDGKAEKVRQESVRGGKVITSSKKTDALVDKKTGLTESQMEVVKLLHLDKDPKKLQIYKNQILKLSNA